MVLNNSNIALAILYMYPSFSFNSIQLLQIKAKTKMLLKTITPTIYSHWTGRRWWDSSSLLFADSLRQNPTQFLTCARLIVYRMWCHATHCTRELIPATGQPSQTWIPLADVVTKIALPNSANVSLTVAIRRWKLLLVAIRYISPQLLVIRMVHLKQPDGNVTYGT